MRSLTLKNDWPAKCLASLSLLLLAKAPLGAESSDLYRMGYLGSSVNVDAAYISALKKTEDGWRLIKVDFLGNIKRGPIVHHATGPIAMHNFIIVPRIDGKVEIYDDVLELSWYFEVKPGRVVGPGARIDAKNAIALLTVTPADQRKYIEVYKIDCDSKSVQLLLEQEVFEVGGLAQYAGNLWHIGKRSATLIEPKKAPIEAPP